MGDFKVTFSQKDQLIQMRLFFFIHLASLLLLLRNILLLYSFFHIIKKYLA